MFFKLTGEIKVACILVNLGVREGFLEDMLLNTWSRNFSQIMGYEGIPFIFHGCHERGDLLAQCKLKFKGRSGEPKLGETLGLEEILCFGGLEK